MLDNKCYHSGEVNKTPNRAYNQNAILWNRDIYFEKIYSKADFLDTLAAINIDMITMASILLHIQPT